MFTTFTKYLKALRIVPSLHIGSRFYHTIFPRRGNLILYITSRCNCKCLICNHWQQDPRDLDPEIIHQLAHSKTISNKSWLIEGGEVFFHPKINTIFEILLSHKVNYTLFTNATMPDLLNDAVDKYQIKSVNISLDGPRETYKLVRGFDGYDRVLESIMLIKDKTNVQISFTISPYNSYEDYLYVKSVCELFDLRLMVNIYSEAAKSGLKRTEQKIDPRYTKISPYVDYYNRWIDGKINIPCRSQSFNVAVFPSGFVHLCPCKFKPLGSLRCATIDQIWNSKDVKKLQRDNLKCNECWVSCYRHFDIKLAKLKGAVCDTCS